MNNEYNQIPNQNNYIEPVQQNYNVPQQPNGNKPKSSKGIITILIITNIITLVALVLCIFVIKPNSKSNEIEKSDNNSEKVNYTPTATTKPVSNNWKEYQFGVNGKTLTLPCSYRELKDVSGFYMSSSVEKSYTAPLRTSTVSIFNGDDEKLIAYIDIKNTTEEDLLNANANVVSISQTYDKYKNYTDEELITFPGNLQVGMSKTEEEIKKLFGEPDDRREFTYSNITSITLLYTADDTYSTVDYYKIEISDGKIEDLTLDHYDRRKKIGG